MFEIEYKGGNAVIITTKKSRLIIDPAVSVVGLKDIEVRQNDVEITTEPRFAATNTTSRLVFEGPGSYEVGDFAIHGVAARRHIDTEAGGNQSTMYSVTVADVRIVIVGNIAPKLSDEQLEELGVADMLIVPVGGGGYTLDAMSATAITRQIEPKVVIPVHYADSNVKYEVPQDSFEDFVKELNVPVVEAGLKYKSKGTSSLPDQLTLVSVIRS